MEHTRKDQERRFRPANRLQPPELPFKAREVHPSGDRKHAVTFGMCARGSCAGGGPILAFPSKCGACYGTISKGAVCLSLKTGDKRYTNQHLRTACWTRSLARRTRLTHSRLEPKISENSAPPAFSQTSPSRNATSSCPPRPSGPASTTPALARSARTTCASSTTSSTSTTRASSTRKPS